MIKFEWLIMLAIAGLVVWYYLRNKKSETVSADSSNTGIYGIDYESQNPVSVPLPVPNTKPVQPQYDLMKILDANQDNIITIGDITKIKRIMMGLDESPLPGYKYSVKDIGELEKYLMSN